MVLSLAFFLLLFGRPGRPIALGWPDSLAADFLPQAALIGLLSAIVPVLVARRELAAHNGRPGLSIRGIVLGGACWSLVALGLGFSAMTLACSWGPRQVDPWQALAVKALFDGILGAAIAVFAVRRLIHFSERLP